VDVNSRGLFGHFTRRLLAQLAVHGPRGAPIAGAASVAGAAGSAGSAAKASAAGDADSILSSAAAGMSLDNSSSSGAELPAVCFGDALIFDEPSPAGATAAAAPTSASASTASTAASASPAAPAMMTEAQAILAETYAAEFSSQRFCPLRSNDNAAQLLKQNKVMFLRIARNIATGASNFEWSLIKLVTE
jgi:hypothetical protein